MTELPLNGGRVAPVPVRPPVHAESAPDRFWGPGMKNPVVLQVAPVSPPTRKPRHDQNSQPIS